MGPVGGGSRTNDRKPPPGGVSGQREGRKSGAGERKEKSMDRGTPSLPARPGGQGWKKEARQERTAARGAHEKGERKTEGRKGGAGEKKEKERKEKSMDRGTPSLPARPGGQGWKKEAPQERTAARGAHEKGERKEEEKRREEGGGGKKEERREEAGEGKKQERKEEKQERKEEKQERKEEKGMEDRSRLAVLTPETQQAFDSMKFAHGFTDIQYYGIPEVLKRKDTIMASQTGASPNQPTEGHVDQREAAV